MIKLYNMTANGRNNTLLTMQQTPSRMYRP